MSGDSDEENAANMPPGHPLQPSEHATNSGGGNPADTMRIPQIKIRHLGIVENGRLNTASRLKQEPLDDDDDAAGSSGNTDHEGQGLNSDYETRATVPTVRSRGSLPSDEREDLIQFVISQNTREQQQHRRQQFIEQHQQQQLQNQNNVQQPQPPSTLVLSTTSLSQVKSEPTESPPESAESTESRIKTEIVDFDSTLPYGLMPVKKEEPAFSSNEYMDDECDPSKYVHFPGESEDDSDDEYEECDCPDCLIEEVEIIDENDPTTPPPTPPTANGEILDFPPEWYAAERLLRPRARRQQGRTNRRQVRRCTWPDCKYTNENLQRMYIHIRKRHFDVAPTKALQKAQNKVETRPPSDFMVTEIMEISVEPLTDFQADQLEAVFLQTINNNPSATQYTTEVETLAYKLHIHERRITDWFKHRRAIQKRMETNGGGVPNVNRCKRGRPPKHLNHMQQQLAQQQQSGQDESQAGCSFWNGRNGQAPPSSASVNANQQLSTSSSSSSNPSPSFANRNCSIRNDLQQPNNAKQLPPPDTSILTPAQHKQQQQQQTVSIANLALQQQQQHSIGQSNAQSSSSLIALVDGSNQQSQLPKTSNVSTNQTVSLSVDPLNLSTRPAFKIVYNGQERSFYPGVPPGVTIRTAAPSQVLNPQQAKSAVSNSTATPASNCSGSSTTINSGLPPINKNGNSTTQSSVPPSQQNMTNSQTPSPVAPSSQSGTNTGVTTTPRPPTRVCKHVLAAAIAAASRPPVIKGEIEDSDDDIQFLPTPLTAASTLTPQRGGGGGNSRTGTITTSLATSAQPNNNTTNQLGIRRVTSQSSSSVDAAAQESEPVDKVICQANLTKLVVKIEEISPKQQSPPNAEGTARHLGTSQFTAFSKNSLNGVAPPPISKEMQQVYSNMARAGLENSGVKLASSSANIESNSGALNLSASTVATIASTSASAAASTPTVNKQKQQPKPVANQNSLNERLNETSTESAETPSCVARVLPLQPSKSTPTSATTSRSPRRQRTLFQILNFIQSHNGSNTSDNNRINQNIRKPTVVANGVSVALQNALLDSGVSLPVTSSRTSNLSSVTSTISAVSTSTTVTISSSTPGPRATTSGKTISRTLTTTSTTTTISSSNSSEPLPKITATSGTPGALKNSNSLLSRPSGSSLSSAKSSLTSSSASTASPSTFIRTESQSKSQHQNKQSRRPSTSSASNVQRKSSRDSLVLDASSSTRDDVSRFPSATKSGSKRHRQLSGSEDSSSSSVTPTLKRQTSRSELENSSSRPPSTSNEQRKSSRDTKKNPQQQSSNKESQQQQYQATKAHRRSLSSPTRPVSPTPTTAAAASVRARLSFDPRSSAVALPGTSSVANRKPVSRQRSQPEVGSTLNRLTTTISRQHSLGNSDSSSKTPRRLSNDDDNHSPPRNRTASSSDRNSKSSQKIPKVNPAQVQSSFYASLFSETPNNSKKPSRPPSDSRNLRKESSSKDSRFLNSNSRGSSSSYSSSNNNNKNRESTPRATYSSKWSSYSNSSAKSSKDHQPATASSSSGTSSEYQRKYQTYSNSNSVSRMQQQQHDFSNRKVLPPSSSTNQNTSKPIASFSGRRDSESSVNREQNPERQPELRRLDITVTKIPIAKTPSLESPAVSVPADPRLARSFSGSVLEISNSAYPKSAVSRPSSSSSVNPVDPKLAASSFPRSVSASSVGQRPGGSYVDPRLATSSLSSVPRSTSFNSTVAPVSSTPFREDTRLSNNAVSGSASPSNPNTPVSANPAEFPNDIDYRIPPTENPRGDSRSSSSSTSSRSRNASGCNNNIILDHVAIKMVTPQILKDGTPLPLEVRLTAEEMCKDQSLEFVEDEEELTLPEIIDDYLLGISELKNGNSNGSLLDGTGKSVADLFGIVMKSTDDGQKDADEELMLQDDHVHDAKELNDEEEEELLKDEEDGEEFELGSDEDSDYEVVDSFIVPPVVSQPVVKTEELEVDDSQNKSSDHSEQTRDDDQHGVPMHSLISSGDQQHHSDDQPQMQEESSKVVAVEEKGGNRDSPASCDNQQHYEKPIPLFSLISYVEHSDDQQQTNVGNVEIVHVKENIPTVDEQQQEKSEKPKNPDDDEKEDSGLEEEEMVVEDSAVVKEEDDDYEEEMEKEDVEVDHDCYEVVDSCIISTDEEMEEFDETQKVSTIKVDQFELVLSEPMDLELMEQPEQEDENQNRVCFSDAILLPETKLANVVMSSGATFYVDRKLDSGGTETLESSNAPTYAAETSELIPYEITMEEKIAYCGEEQKVDEQSSKSNLEGLEETDFEKVESSLEVSLTKVEPLKTVVSTELSESTSMNPPAVLIEPLARINSEEEPPKSITDSIESFIVQPELVAESKIPVIAIDVSNHEVNGGLGNTKLLPAKSPSSSQRLVHHDPIEFEPNMAILVPELTEISVLVPEPVTMNPTESVLVVVNSEFELSISSSILKFQSLPQESTESESSSESDISTVNLESLPETSEVVNSCPKKFQLCEMPPMILPAAVEFNISRLSGLSSIDSGNNNEPVELPSSSSNSVLEEVVKEVEVTESPTTRFQAAVVDRQSNNVIAKAPTKLNRILKRIESSKSQDDAIDEDDEDNSAPDNPSKRPMRSKDQQCTERNQSLLKSKSKTSISSASWSSSASNKDGGLKPIYSDSFYSTRTATNAESNDEMLTRKLSLREWSHKDGQKDSPVKKAKPSTPSGGTVKSNSDSICSKRVPSTTTATTSSRSALRSSTVSSSTSVVEATPSSPAQQTRQSVRISCSKAEADEDAAGTRNRREYFLDYMRKYRDTKNTENVNQTNKTPPAAAAPSSATKRKGFK